MDDSTTSGGRPAEVVITPSPVATAAAEDGAASQGLLERVAAGELRGAIRIWRPVPALALSRLDARRPGAAGARAAAERHRVRAVTRMSGGHAVALGSGSLCAGLAEPSRALEGADGRYERMSEALLATLRELGIDAQLGELPGEWCPGTSSIRSGGVKLAGLAQRVVKGAGWVEAVVELAPDEDARALLAEAYEALELPLDTRTFGTVSELLSRDVGFDEVAEPLAARLRRHLAG